MAERDAIDGLIATYRELNRKVRPLPEERLRVGDREAVSQDGPRSVRQVVTRLRDDELKFSQMLKERTTGVHLTDAFGDDGLVLGTESSDDTTATILAQFGTARESTLAMLRQLPAEEWERTDGDQSIRGLVQKLVERDRLRLERIVGLLGSP